MNRREQPYGIEWWIDLLFQAVDREEKSIDSFMKTKENKYLKEMGRYGSLSNWIHSRISNKYGEEK